MSRRQRTTTRLNEDFDDIMTSNTIHFAMVLHPHLSLSFTSVSLSIHLSREIAVSVPLSLGLNPSLIVLPSLSFSILFPQSFSLNPSLSLFSSVSLHPPVSDSLSVSVASVSRSHASLSIFLICSFCRKPEMTI